MKFNDCLEEMAHKSITTVTSKDVQRDIVEDDTREALSVLHALLDKEIKNDRHADEINVEILPLPKPPKGIAYVSQEVFAKLNKPNSQEKIYDLLKTIYDKANWIFGSKGEKSLKLYLVRKQK
jgi:hypothetical protein